MPELSKVRLMCGDQRVRSLHVNEQLVWRQNLSSLVETFDKGIGSLIVPSYRPTVSLPTVEDGYALMNSSDLGWDTPIQASQMISRESFSPLNSAVVFGPFVIPENLALNLGVMILDSDWGEVAVDFYPGYPTMMYIADPATADYAYQGPDFDHSAFAGKPCWVRISVAETTARVDITSDRQTWTKIGEGPVGSNWPSNLNFPATISVFVYNDGATVPFTFRLGGINAP